MGSCLKQLIGFVVSCCALTPDRPPLLRPPQRKRNEKQTNASPLIRSCSACTFFRKGERGGATLTNTVNYCITVKLNSTQKWGEGDGAER